MIFFAIDLFPQFITTLVVVLLTYNQDFVANLNFSLKNIKKKRLRKKKPKTYHSFKCSIKQVLFNTVLDTIRKLLGKKRVAKFKKNKVFMKFLSALVSVKTKYQNPISYC